MALEERELTLRKDRPLSISEAKEFAKWAVESRKFKNIRSPQQAIILMQYGAELGMGPATALQSVYEVNGTPSLKAAAIAARIKSLQWRDTLLSRYDYRVREYTDLKCVVEFFERSDSGEMDSRGLITYTMEDAKRAGNIKNDTYRKFPRNMLFARAITEGARVFCPDCFGGLAAYTPDELGEPCGSDGTPIDVDFEMVGIADEEFLAIKEAADAKDVCLPEVVRELGGDPNSVRDMTRSLYDAASRIIEAK